MPEISEVRRYVDQLNTEYGGHDLLNVGVVGGRFAKSDDDTEMSLAFLEFPLLNVTMHAKGKFIYWTMQEGQDDPNLHFFITLGMSGSFGKQQKHSALKFVFDNGEVFFNDPRHFGTFRIVNEDMELSLKLSTLGWDPLQYPIIPSDITKTLRKKSDKTISEVLLDQRIFAGVGNYIRSEALYAAKMHPNKLVRDLTDNDIERLCGEIILIVKEAYKAGGATIATYSDLYGNVGTFFKQFKVYSKKQDPLGNTVSKLTAADGRTVHYVPGIQLL